MANAWRKQEQELREAQELILRAAELCRKAAENLGEIRGHRAAGDLEDMANKEIADWISDLVDEFGGFGDHPVW